MYFHGQPVSIYARFFHHAQCMQKRNASASSYTPLQYQYKYISSKLKFTSKNKIYFLFCLLVFYKHETKRFYLVSCSCIVWCCSALFSHIGWTDDESVDGMHEIEKLKKNSSVGRQYCDTPRLVYKCILFVCKQTRAPILRFFQSMIFSTAFT